MLTSLLSLNHGKLLLREWSALSNGISHHYCRLPYEEAFDQSTLRLQRGPTLAVLRGFSHDSAHMSERHISQAV